MANRVLETMEDTGRSRWTWSIVLGVLLCLLSHRAARAQVTSAPLQPTRDAIVLHETVQVVSSEGITLGHVANVSGPSAETLKRLIVRPVKVGDSFALSVDSVREQLERIHQQNMGRITVSGATVRITLQSQAAPLQAETPAPQAAEPAITGPTIRSHALAALAAHVSAPQANIRAEFAPADASLLNTPVLAGQIVSVVPTSKASEVPLLVRVFAGDKLVSSGTLRAKVSILRDVLVATKDIERGSPVDSTNSKVESRWLAFSNLSADAQALSALPDEGAVAKVQVAAAQPIGSRHIALPVLIEKGDVVAVDCVRNGIVVRASLRALSDGKLHDIIELSPLAANRTAKDRKEKREPTIIRARVVGAGRAVMLLAGDPDAQPAKVPETTRVASMHPTMESPR
jgi:flagella basal body P-ring formation protein FlgA